MKTKEIQLTQISDGNSRNQIVMAAALISILPFLSFTYMYLTTGLQLGWLSAIANKLIIGSTVILLSAGALLLFDHVKRVTKLCRFSSDATRTMFQRQNIQQLEPAKLHNLKYVEQCIAFSLTELGRTIADLEQKDRTEKGLKEQLDHYRDMMDGLDDRHLKIEDAASTIKLRLSAMQRMELPLEQAVQVEECAKEIKAILADLAELQQNQTAA